MQLRRAQVGDERAVAEVHVRSWQVGYRGLIADDYLDGLRPEDRAGRYTFDVDDPLTIVAVTDRIRGFASISPGAGELGASTSIRRRGARASAELIIEAERRLAERHAVAGLWVLAGNVRARRFYEAGGWRTDGTERAERVFGVPVVEARYRKTLAR